ncbi:type II secretion system F family protein [Kitasatospora viridis]|uniref:Type II secretion system (T2SS) protein F n=1 Tax=Kitasatospora viridis TaxID=281105 RepID=A0A561UAR9_9ACTN|nr:type II secretion system F family protein [Kitasatospora viridis]TWF96462.1 type II secretion system (T2SS) protein F [Kitasatospora viridis]
MISPWAILAGCVAAAGLALLIAELRPAPPDLGQTLDRLHRPAEPVRANAEPVDEKWYDRLGGRALGVLGVRLPVQSLALIGRTPARFMAHKLLFGLIGLMLPAYLTAMLVALGYPPPVALPVVVSLGLAVLGWLLPDGIVQGEAKEARTEYLHAISAYLELVALERAADHGPAEAMRRAAAVGRGAVFRRIQDALERAATDRMPPWEGLEALSGELGLTQLQDVADIMRLSGADGAAVYDTLRARAKGLRDELLADDLARAGATSEQMVAPGAALTLLMTILIVYPALYQMLHVF